VRGVTGGGYETLGQALAGELTLKVLLALCLMKGIATVFSYSSGGAGGIFAPALFVGGMLGGAVGFLDVATLHHEPRQLGAFALVGMGAVFAGVIRAPITSVLIIFEMTGGYGLVLPLMLANMTSYALTRRWRPTPVYDALLAQDGVILPHGSARSHPLDQLTVADAMSSPAVSGTLDQTVRDGLELLGDRNFELLPVLDSAATLAGVVRVPRLRAAAASGDERATLSSLLEPARTVRSNASLIRSVVQMNDAGVRQFVVVDAAQAAHLVGVIAISDFVRAHARVVPGSKDAYEPAASRPPSSRFAREIMAPVDVAPGETRLDTLREQLIASAARALVVEGPPHEYGVVLLEYISDLGRDDELQSVFIAADVARRAPLVAQSADLSEVVWAFTQGNPEAIIVTESRGGIPSGVITRSTLAGILLDWYATQLRAGAGKGTPPRP
jgi:CBS domain-containing protein